MGYVADRIDFHNFLPCLSRMFLYVSRPVSVASDIFADIFNRLISDSFPHTCT